MKHYNVVAAIICYDGKVLAMQRGQTKFDYTAYKWEFPGGKIESGETPEEALQREILEEMDMRITVGRHLITVDHTYDDFSITMQCFLCAANSPEFTMREHHSFKWMLPEELDNLDWAGADVAVSEAVKQMLGKI